jgi:hypothetical protein
MEARRTKQKHIRQRTKFESPIRMSRPRGSGTARNRRGELLQLMTEYKLIEVMKNRQMLIPRDLKPDNQFQISPTKQWRNS